MFSLTGFCVLLAIIELLIMLQRFCWRCCHSQQSIIISPSIEGGVSSLNILKILSLYCIFLIKINISINNTVKSFNDLLLNKINLNFSKLLEVSNHVTIKEPVIHKNSQGLCTRRPKKFLRLRRYVLLILKIYTVLN